MTVDVPEGMGLNDIFSAMESAVQDGPAEPKEAPQPEPEPEPEPEPATEELRIIPAGEDEPEEIYYDPSSISTLFGKKKSWYKKASANERVKKEIRINKISVNLSGGREFYDVCWSKSGNEIKILSHNIPKRFSSYIISKAKLVFASL